MIDDVADTLSLVLLFLAVARTTRLVTSDRLTRAPREWLILRAEAKHGPDALSSYLIQCPWCVSIWAGAAGAGAWWAWGDTRAFLAVCAALAASHVTGWFATREG